MAGQAFSIVPHPRQALTPNPMVWLDVWALKSLATKTQSYGPFSVFPTENGHVGEGCWERAATLVRNPGSKVRKTRNVKCDNFVFFGCCCQLTRACPGHGPMSEDASWGKEQSGKNRGLLPLRGSRELGPFPGVGFQIFEVLHPPGGF